MLVVDRQVPAFMQVTACIWVLAGAVNIFNALTFMGLTYSTPLSALVVGTGLIFVGMGMEVLTGRLKDTLLCGLFSLLSSVPAALTFESIEQYGLGSASLTGLLFAAGISSLIGRSAYRTRNLRPIAAPTHAAP
jgi:hypothetical protein